MSTPMGFDACYHDLVYHDRDMALAALMHKRRTGGHHEEKRARWDMRLCEHCGGPHVFRWTKAERR
jgi:hypothetical protein